MPHFLYEHFTISLLEQMWSYAFPIHLVKSILLSDALSYCTIFALFYFVSESNFQV